MIAFLGPVLHDSWGDPPHVTSSIWGPPLQCKQALNNTIASILYDLFLT